MKFCAVEEGKWLYEELGGGHKFFFWLIKQIKSFFVMQGRRPREEGKLNLPEEDVLGSALLD